MFDSKEIIKKSTGVGKNIKKWRQFKGISKKDFALKLYISPKTLCKIENDKLHISTLQLRIIATQLQVGLIQLLQSPQKVSLQNLSVI